MTRDAHAILRGGPLDGQIKLIDDSNLDNKLIIDNGAYPGAAYEWNLDREVVSGYDCYVLVFVPPEG